MRHAHPVVIKDAASAAVLDTPVLHDIPPRGHRGLISRKRKRYQLAIVRHALKALDRNESVDLLNEGHERPGHVEIALLFAELWPRLKDHDDHLLSRA